MYPSDVHVGPINKVSMYRLFMTTGYDLSERQLSVYLNKFGKLSDLYLPKRADGRSKGFFGATFTTKKALSSA